MLAEKHSVADFLETWLKHEMLLDTNLAAGFAQVMTECSLVEATAIPHTAGVSDQFV